MPYVFWTQTRPLVHTALLSTLPKSLTSYWKVSSLELYMLWKVLSSTDVMKECTYIYHCHRLSFKNKLVLKMAPRILLILRVFPLALLPFE